MADATRFQVLSKQIEEPKQATDSISTQIEKLTQSHAQIDRLVQSQQKMEAMMTTLISQTSIPARPPSQPPDPPDCKSHTGFPKFDGTLVREWFRRCDQYFYLHKTPPEMRVRIATPRMIGKALQWHTNYIKNNFGMFPPWLDYTIAISAEFGDEDALLMHQSSLSPYQNQYNQSHYKIPNTTSLLPPLEITKALPNKPNLPTEINMENSPRKLSHEEIQESEMRVRCESSDGSYANGHHLESKKSHIFVVECDDEESIDVREPSEATVEELIDKSREEKPTPENGSSPEVSPQILLSQFQVSLSTLEPVRRYHKEPLVVVNDLSSDLRCVIGKTHGFNYDPELGQANSHDEEEFKGLNLGKLLENERLLSIVCLLGLNDMSCWTQLLRQQIFPKSWRFKFKTESSEEAVTVLEACPQLLNTFFLICDNNKLDNSWVCNDRQKEAVCDAENKKLLSIEVDAKKGKNSFMNPQPLHDKRITRALQVGLGGTEEKISDRLSLANYVWKPGELLGVQDQWDWISEVHSGGGVLKITQRLRGMRLQGFTNMDKKLEKVLLDDVLRVMVCWSVHNRMCEIERKIYISANQNSRNQELLITYRFLMIGKFSWSKRLNETCCFLLEVYFEKFVGCNAHENETQSTNQSHGMEGSKRDIQGLENGYKRIVLKLKLPLSSGADWEQLFKWVDIHFSDNQRQEGLLSFPWELMLANLKENHACGVDTRFLEPDRYEFIWWVSSTCEADHISSETFSVGAVHGFFTGSKLHTGDETQEKRLLFLNNHNKVDPTVKENWFYNEPMIRGVFHLQRPPELFDLPGNLDFITKVIVQWKEHPPDQFFSGFYRQVLMLSSLRTRMF